MNYSVVYRQDSTCAKYNEKHFHNNAMEIIQIVSGKGTLLSGGLIRPFEKGDIFVIDGTVIHCLAPDNPEDYVRNKLVVDRNVFLELMGKDLSKKNVYIVTDKTIFEKIDKLFERISENVNDSSKRLLALSDVFLLLHICVENADDRMVIKKGFVSDAIEYINENITELLTIDDISEHIHVSKFHICRRFKKETGMTINNYIKSTRMNNARQLLVYSDKSISKIAEETGFSDLPTFTKAFKQMIGFTPTSFRKKFEALKYNKM